MRLIDFFERGHRYHPDRACLIDAAGTLSYREVARRSHRTANALIAGGLVPGDRVAILSANSSRAFEAWIGAARAGGVWVGLAALASPEENAYVIDQRGAAWLFYESRFEAAAAHFRAHCPQLRAPPLPRRRGRGRARLRAPSSRDTARWRPSCPTSATR